MDAIRKTEVFLGFSRFFADLLAFSKTTFLCEQKDASSPIRRSERI